MALTEEHLGLTSFQDEFPNPFTYAPLFVWNIALFDISKEFPGVGVILLGWLCGEKSIFLKESSQTLTCILTVGLDFDSGFIEIQQIF